MTILQDVRDAMHRARSPWYAKDHQGCGFYAIYLKANAELPFVELADDRLLYVGMTKAGFANRDHFAPRSGHSGGCTLRRSLGAILKHELKLKARPRSRSAAPYQFRFDPAGEHALSEWMKGSLYLSRVPFGSNVDLAEAQLIRAFEPPLNLKGWHNPQAALIKRFRLDCANEAEAFARRAADAA